MYEKNNNIAENTGGPEPDEKKTEAVETRERAFQEIGTAHTAEPEFQETEASQGAEPSTKKSEETQTVEPSISKSETAQTVEPSIPKSETAQATEPLPSKAEATQTTEPSTQTAEEARTAEPALSEVTGNTGGSVQVELSEAAGLVPDKKPADMTPLSNKKLPEGGPERGDKKPEKAKTAKAAKAKKDQIKKNNDKKERANTAKAKNLTKAQAPQEPDKSLSPVKAGKKKKRHIGLFILGFLAALLLLAYFCAAYFFRTHFLPNTYLNGLDVSYLDVEGAEEVLEGHGLRYELKVLGRDGEEIGVISAADVDLTVDTHSDVVRLLQAQDVYQWPNAFSGTRGEELTYTVGFDRDKLRKLVTGWDAMQVKNIVKPENAYISEYRPELKGYEIVPETYGTQVDVEKVLTAVEAALVGWDKQLELEAADCYVEADITSDDVKLNKKLDTLNKWTGTRIIYDWNGAEVVLDGDLIHEWILEDGEELRLDEEAVAGFVAEQAKKNDTYGKKRNFVTAQGVELSLRSGAYGWKTDRAAETEELLELIRQGSVTDREPVYTMQGAKKGQEDIGSTYVEIDLTNQHLYLFENGQIVLETDFVSGDMTISGRMTPPGVFGLTYKTTNAVLRGEDYETPVKYWMPFNGNVGMHDATWRSSFGGDIYITNGSHGCINLPLKKAKEIYGYVSTGFPVICYYY